MATVERHHTWLCAAELTALAALAAATLALLPWAEALRTTAALAVAYLPPRALYRRSGHCTAAGRAVLLLAAVGLSAIAVPMLYHATVASGATFRMPRLVGDASDYYNWALAHYDGSAVKPKVTFWGYSVLIIGLWRVLGVSVIWPVAANVMATLLSIVLTGHVAAAIAATRRRRTATLAMAMIAVQAYFMSQGAQMLKEPWVYLAIMLIALSLVPRPDREQGTANSEQRGSLITHHSSLITMFALGCFILAAVRAKYVNFVFIGLIMLAVAGRLRQWRRYGLLLAITLLCWWLGMAMTDHYTVMQQVNNVTGQGGMAGLFAPEGVYQHLVGDYFRHPVWHKLLLLPVTCSAQWVIPFPWLPQDEAATWLSVVPRLRLGWYVLSGTVIYFYLFRSWRRGWQWAAWAWFPMVCFAAIAYMTAGTVSRYILPFEPWWMAMAAVAVMGSWRQRQFRVFMAAYFVFMTVVLVISHHALMTAT